MWKVDEDWFSTLPSSVFNNEDHVSEGEIRAYTVVDGTVYQCCRQHIQCNGCLVAREHNH